MSGLARRIKGRLRREFLARSVAVRRPLRVGIVGFGGIGPDHAAAFNDLASAQVVAISDLSPQRLGGARSRSGQLRTYCDYRKMLKEVRPDIISICTWPQSHRDVLRDAAEAGVKGVMCEKPLALTSEHLDSMKRICDEYGVKLACGHQYRFHPYFMRAREIVAAGEAGEIQRVRGHIRGSLANNGPHLIDTVRYLLSDAPITEVFADFDQLQFSIERGLPAETEASGHIVFQPRVRFEFVTGKIAPSFFEIALEGTRGTVTVAPDMLQVSGSDRATGPADQAEYRQRQFGEFVDWVRGRRANYASDATSSAETARAVIGLYDSGRQRRVLEWPASANGDVISRAFNMEVSNTADDQISAEPQSLWPSNSSLAINGGDRAVPDWFSVAPQIGLPEFKGVAQVLRSKQLSSTDGLVVRDFERQFAKSYGAPHAVASTSGTSAIHVALGALNLLPGDEVITTPVSDMGTLIPILACNLTPVFADIDPLTGNLTAETIAAKITARTKAVILVHLFGRPADLDPICELLRARNISLIEDCAQAHLAEYKGKKVGTFGAFGCFSFQQSKQVTCGDGGITLVNSTDYYKRAALFIDKGWDRAGGGRAHLFFGMNYRMTELQGAVARAQISRLPDMVRRRRSQAQALTERLSHAPGVILPVGSPGTDPAWWMFHFNVDEELVGLETAKFVELLNSEGVYAKHAYLRRQLFEEDMFQCSRRGENTGYPAFLQSEAGLPVADDFPGVQEFLARSVLIFWSDRVLDRHVDGISRAVKKVVDAVGNAGTFAHRPSDELELSLT